MRATGIVRRVDDLGRIVIPREIRNTLNIREGDPLEIFTEDRAVIFKPYLPYQEPWRLLEDAAEVIAEDENFREFKRAILDLARKMKQSAPRD